MLAYVIRRLALIIPTLLGIMVINFAIAQVAPGGPVEQMIAKIKGETVAATARFASTNSGEAQNASGPSGTKAAGINASSPVEYRGAQGLDPEVLKEIKVRLGFDKPPLERFLLMMKGYLTFDFGKSFYSDRTVVSLLISKMPVSISLGLWTTLLVYLISIPLGVAKAVRDGSRFDIWSSAVIIVGYAIPGFLFAILLVVVFAGGSFLDWFPLRGLTSPNWEQLSWPARIADYFWHITLPILSMVVGGFAGLSMLTKNSFLAEINKQYVVTARSKGLSERRVLYGHVFRNAMLLITAGFPGAFMSILFTGAMLTEIIFSLDGLGLLGFEAIVNRDYPVMFASLYLFTLLGLLLNLVSDLTYHLIDPRIDFESRGA